MEEKIKEFWKQKQVAFYHIFLDVMLLIYCISFYFAGNQVVTIRYVRDKIRGNYFPDTVPDLFL